VEAGEDFFVRGVVDQQTVDVVVRILLPDGSLRTQFDMPARGAERFQFETGDDPGSWTVEVAPFEDEEGAYAITLERLEPLAEDPRELADQLLSAWDREDAPGAAVRVWRDGEELYTRAVGMANLAYGVPFEPDTPTNIGSTSKQFTAFAVQLLAERGELSLDDPVVEHLPELRSFEDTVRVRHLLTHTSGYREIYNLLTMAGRRFDQGDFVDRGEILAVVRNQPALQNEPGAEWNYNNTAFALAAMVVERVSGMPFHEFMEENVFELLGMDGTQVRPDPQAIVEGRSMGYAPDDDGGWREIRDLGGAVGAGAIYATVEDLERWVENYREPRVGTREMIDEMTTPYVLTGGDTTQYGLGLFIDEQRGLRRVHHGGADIAHRSMLAYYPEIGAGITVQSNDASFRADLAFRLAEAFFEDAMEPEEETVAEEGAFDAEAYDPEAFDDVAGRYALEANPAFVITLSREGDTLYAQATGQRRLRLEPTSDTTFALQGVEASLTVHTGEEGRATAITLHQGGVDQRATRIEGDTAEAWAPDREALAELTGRYLSRELDTFYSVVLEEHGQGEEDEEARLVLRHRRVDDATLTPGERDTFTAGPLQLSFERDRNGQVIGFYMSNGRTRNVRFERMP
jgi:CubicO group peptidase (beta-lactamase class C family)